MSTYIPRLWLGYGRPLQTTINLNRVDTAQRYPLGWEVCDDKGCVYRYVAPPTTVTGGNFVAETTTPNAVVDTAALNDVVVGVAPVTIPSNHFGWIKVRGVHESANVADGSGAGKNLVASAAGGRLAEIDSAAQLSQEEGRRIIAQKGGVRVFAITAATVAHTATVRLH